MEKSKISVKKIVDTWENGGIPALKILFSESIVFEDTWAFKIQNLIEEGHIKSANKEIELISFNLDLTNKIDKNGK